MAKRAVKGPDPPRPPSPPSPLSLPPQVGLLLFSCIISPIEHFVAFAQNSLTRLFEYQARVRRPTLHYQARPCAGSRYGGGCRRATTASRHKRLDARHRAHAPHVVAGVAAAQPGSGRLGRCDTGWAAARRPCRVAWLDPGMDKGRPTEGRRAPGVVEAKLRRELSLARLSA